MTIHFGRIIGTPKFRPATPQDPHNIAIGATEIEKPYEFSRIQGLNHNNGRDEVYLLSVAQPGRTTPSYHLNLIETPDGDVGQFFVRIYNPRKKTFETGYSLELSDPALKNLPSGLEQHLEDMRELRVQMRNQFHGAESTAQG